MKSNDQINKKKEEEKNSDGTEEWKSKYLRALADYQNLEKRVAVNRAEEFKLAAKNFILKILPVLDVLENAQKQIKDKGLELAVKLFHEVLKKEQVERIEVVGKKFDPYLMDCVDVAESEKENEVIEELRAGYRLWDKVIRPAQVKVGKGKKD